MARPQLVLLDLMGWIPDFYNRLVTQLHKHADVTKVDKTTASTLFGTLAGRGQPVVILAADGGLADKEWNNLRSQAVAFVKAGGTLVFGLNTSSFTNAPDMKKLFHDFGVGWEASEYHREDFRVNPGAQSMPTDRLEAAYSQKALQVKNVKASEAVYLSTEVEQKGSLMSTPAAFAKVGEGRVGYTGDVNAEAETDRVVLTMCGLLR